MLLHCQMKEQVGAYVGDLLKPRFKSNAITKEDYKWIVRKTVDKVLLPVLCLLADPVAYCLAVAIHVRSVAHLNASRVTALNCQCRQQSKSVDIVTHCHKCCFALFTLFKLSAAV